MCWIRLNVSLRPKSKFSLQTITALANYNVNKRGRVISEISWCRGWQHENFVCPTLNWGCWINRKSFSRGLPNQPSVTPSSVIISATIVSPQTHLLSLGVQAEQADKATDLQQEINKNSQASKQRESPHCGHVGQGSYRRQKKSTVLSACDLQGNWHFLL